MKTTGGAGSAEDRTVESKKAILCIDDEVVVLLALTRELKMAFDGRFLYEQATDAERGLEAVEELAKAGIRIIFVITDWLMPGMKGDEFIEHIHERHPEINAIMITGQADQAAIERIKRNPAVRAVMSKPWNARELISIIEKYADTY
jgi:CheY-like chemotaxis protein